MTLLPFHSSIHCTITLVKEARLRLVLVGAHDLDGDIQTLVPLGKLVVLGRIQSP